MCQQLKISSENRRLRNALGQFATGVAILATRKKDASPVGMTVNSFNSISLNPPLISVCIALGAKGYRHYASTSTFAITVLGRHQETLAKRFASSGTDKFANICLSDNHTPVIPGGVAWFRCQSYRKVLLGDHLLLVGKVTDFSENGGEPLAFHRGKFIELAPSSTAPALVA